MATKNELLLEFKEKFQWFNAFSYLEKNTLTEKETLVIKLRKIEKKTLKEVGKECGVTRERIRQIEAKAEMKITFTGLFETWLLSAFERLEK